MHANFFTIHPWYWVPVSLIPSHLIFHLISLHIPHSLPRLLLNIVPRIRPSRRTHLVLSHRMANFLDVDELFYPHDLAGDGL
jgi:hypothetical protein